MQNDDEPVLGKRGGGPAPEDPRSLLCTQGEGQPYASLVAFAFTEDLHTAVFVTPMATRKYKLLVDCVRVALLVDNRPSHPDDMMKVEAVTATGRASEIARGPLFEQRAALLLRKHSYLEAFVRAESCALFTIDIRRSSSGCRSAHDRAAVRGRT
jgi:hypothetical protein